MHYSLALFLAPMQTRLKSSVLNEIFRKKEGRGKSSITYIRNEDPTNYKNVSPIKTGEISREGVPTSSVTP